MRNHQIFTTLLVIAFAFLFGSNAQAQTSANDTVVIDGISYEIASGTSECTLVKVPMDPSRVVIPELSIPASISYNGREYTVTRIGKKAFYVGSYRYIDMKLPNSIKEIGDSAFMDQYITRINIPQSVKSIGKKAFGAVNKKIHVDLMYLDVDADCKFGDTEYWAKCIFAPTSKLASYRESTRRLPAQLKYTTSSEENFWKITKKLELTKANLVGTWRYIIKESTDRHTFTDTHFFTFSSNGMVSYKHKVHQVYNGESDWVKEIKGASSLSGSYFIEDNVVKCIVNQNTVRNNYSYIPTEKEKLKEKYNPRIKVENQNWLKENRYWTFTDEFILVKNKYISNAVIIDNDDNYLLRVNETTAPKTAAKKPTTRKTVTRKK